LFAISCLYIKVTNSIKKLIITIFVETINNRLQTKIFAKEFNINIFAKEFNINIFIKEFNIKKIVNICCYYNC